MTCKMSCILAQKLIFPVKRGLMITQVPKKAQVLEVDARGSKLRDPLLSPQSASYRDNDSHISISKSAELKHPKYSILSDILNPSNLAACPARRILNLQIPKP